MTFSTPQLLIGIGAAAVVALASWRARFLQPSGAVATFALGSVVFGFGGFAWSAPLVAFFLFSSLLSSYGPKRQRRAQQRLEGVFEKGSRRDAGQVFANGGIAGLMMIAWAIHPAPAFHAAYLGALAAAAADTWATEIGILSRRPPWLIVGLRPAPVGTSGAVSAVGTLGAMAGALSVALAGVFFAPRSWPLWLAITVVAGLCGMIADSLAGALLQARYRCPVCGVATERAMHCDAPATLVAGNAHITNDVVNIICCLAGAAVAAGLLLLLP